MDIRYRCTGLNSSFHYTGSSFAEYIEQIQHLIASTRADLTPANRDKIIDANTPYQWYPNNRSEQQAPGKKFKNGILLIHGLLESPFSMRDMGKHFLEKDFLVRSVLLPGHGTVPGDLLEVKAESWHTAVSYGINSMLKEVENIYLLGFSGGATLALEHAFRDAPIKGIFLFAPSIKLNSRSVFLAGVLRHLHKIYPPAAWYVRRDDNDYAKYESCCFNLAYEAYVLTKRLLPLRRAKPLPCPMFMVLSEDDETICSANALHFFGQHPHPNNRVILYSKQEHEFDNPQIIVRNSSFPEQQILDFSHVCLQISPDNPHYGKYGDYFPPTRFLGKPGQHPVYVGSLSKNNLRDYTTRRLTYNPDYEYLLQAIDNFLEVL